MLLSMRFFCHSLFLLGSSRASACACYRDVLGTEAQWQHTIVVLLSPCLTIAVLPQAPAFTGEEVPMGPLKAVITTALLMRSSLRALMSYVGLQQFAPHASYARALARCASFQVVFVYAHRSCLHRAEFCAFMQGCVSEGRVQQAAA